MFVIDEELHLGILSFNMERFAFFVAAFHSLMFVKSIVTTGIGIKIERMQVMFSQIIQKTLKQRSSDSFSTAGRIHSKQGEFGRIGKMSLQQQLLIDVIDGLKNFGAVFSEKDSHRNAVGNGNSRKSLIVLNISVY